MTQNWKLSKVREKKKHFKKILEKYRILQFFQKLCLVLGEYNIKWNLKYVWLNNFDKTWI